MLIPLATLLALAVLLLLVQRLIGRLFRRTVLFEYQRGLLYRNGVFQRVLTPGAYWHLVAASTITTVDLRPRIAAVPNQEILSADNISLKLSLAAQYAVADPAQAAHATQDYSEALYLLLQLALREQVSGVPVEQLLATRKTLGATILERVAPQAAAIGLSLTLVEVKDVTFPGELKRVFAQVVTAQKEGLATLERARGESAALRNLANSAKLLEQNPTLLQLRALLAVSQGSGNTVVFNVPQQPDRQSGQSDAQGAGASQDTS
jgi:regulator of protease activity HflC (stomatin/prohibitin superfamily)